MPVEPYVSDPDFTLYVGDVRDVLAELPDGSIDCVVTSPPYWGLRDYGTDGQLGLEATPDEYVASMVAVFREVRRVLAAHGTCWVNLGDSYAAGNVIGRTDAGRNFTGGGGNREGSGNPGYQGRHERDTGLKPKDLVGIPWRVAFALQADGWYLRADVIWSKPNPMPESVTDRPTKAHEYVFLLSKRPRYWFDQEAVREAEQVAQQARAHRRRAQNGGTRIDGGHKPVADFGRISSESQVEPYGTGTRNVRSVWEIATQPYPEAHFATYPEELVRRCLLAGCPEWVCRVCGKPRERIVERGESDYARLGKQNGVDFGRNDSQPGNMGQTRTAHGTVPSLRAASSTTVGWSDCGHNNYRPGVVLDPFMGSGTTALVARRHGRRAVGIELNPKYAELAARRLSQLSLLAEVNG